MNAYYSNDTSRRCGAVVLLPFVKPSQVTRWVIPLLVVMLLSSGLRSDWLAQRVAADAPFSASSQINDDGLSPVPPNRWMPSLVANGGQVFVGAVVEGLWPSDLYLSRSTDAGVSWLSPEPRIDGDPGVASQMSPALAILPNGTLGAVWVDSRSGDSDIYFAKSLADGETWSKPDVPLSSGPTATQQWAPAVTADATGVLYAVWEDSRDGWMDIYFARSVDGGLTWTNPNVRVNDGSHPGGFYPTIAVVSGTVVVAWAGDAVSPLRNDLDIYAARSLDGGITWSPTQSVTTDVGGWNVFSPSLAAGPGGDLLLSWSDERNGFQQIYASRSLDEGQTWTDPGVRIRPTARVQDDPSSIVTSAGLGVAWIDNRDSLLRVFFARSTDGFAWNETQVSGAEFGERALSALASDGAKLYAVWQENPTGGIPERWQVHLARSDDQGLTWNPDVQLPSPPPVPADQSNPSIVVDRNGTVYAAWMDHRNAGDFMMNKDGDIYFTRSTDGGPTWAQPSIRVSDPLVGAAESAPRLREAPDGRLHLIWEDRQRRLVAAQSDDGGWTWTPAIPIAPDPSLTDQIYPDFVVNATGSLFVVFQGYQNPGWSAYFVRSTDGGISWTTVLLPSGESRDAAVAADTQGNLYAGWGDLFSRFMVARSSDGGTTWSPPVAVTPGGSFFPHGGRLATDADGTVYAVWSESGAADVYFSRSTDRAASWSPAVRLNLETGPAWQEAPALAVGRQGSVYVAWTDGRNGNYDIYAVNTTDGGLTWPAVEWRVNDEVPGSHQLEASLFADRYNRIYAAWKDDRTGDWDIRFARFDPFANQRPRASFVVDPPSGTVQTSFTLNASGSMDAEDPPSDLQVRWDWEDDGTWDTAWSTVKVTQHAYPSTGARTIRLEVRDTDGLTDQVTETVWVNNTAPTASFTAVPATGNVTTDVTFDASGSSDLEDPVSSLQVRWDWEDDGTWDTTFTGTKTAQHRFAVLGVHSICLEVRDSEGLTSSSVRSVTVMNTPPVASFTTSPTSGNIDTTFHVDASASSDLENASGSLEVRWDWEDDGTWDTAWSAVKTASHRYGQPGTYTIRLEVRDGAGATSTIVSDVVVLPNSGATPNGDSVGLALYIIVALAVVGALAAGIYLMRWRKRARGDPPEAG